MILASISFCDTVERFSSLTFMFLLSRIVEHESRGEVPGALMAVSSTNQALALLRVSDRLTQGKEGLLPQFQRP